MAAVNDYMNASGALLKPMLETNVTVPTEPRI